MAANQKEYRMLWTLAASLAGNFSSTFQKAKKELEEVQKAQRELDQQNKNVATYKTLQKEIEETTRKYNSFKEKLKNVQEEIANTENPNAKLKNQAVDLQEKVVSLNQKLWDKKERLLEISSALGITAGDTEALSKREQELKEQSEGLTKRQQELNETLSKGERNFGTFADAVVASGIVEYMSDLAHAYGECVQAAAAFEESMSNVEALSGANALEMEHLKDKALDLAASTKFTALEVGDAMGYMGMAGWDAEEMLSGMSGVINLAAASGEDLATVSDIVTDNLTAFRMTAGQTAEMADILAAAATNSNTNVEIMGETFKNSAAVAGALGYSLDDVALAVGIMANNGIKGSIAGTALRNIFNGLLKDVTLTSSAFGEYEVNAVKADGTLKSFRETVAELRTQFNLMTEAEKVMNAKDLAGMRGYNGLLAIINASEDDLDALEAKINNSAGAAQKMANIKLDNLNGQLTIMKSAWDAIKITLGSEFNEELTTLVKLLTEVLHGVNSLMQAHPAITKGVVAATGAIVGLTAAINGYKVASAAVGLITEKLGAGLLGFSGAALGVAAAIGAVTVAYTAYKDSEAYKTSQLTAVSREQKKELEALKAEYDSMSDKSTEQAMDLEVQIKAAQASYENYAQTAKDLRQELDDTTRAYAELSSAQEQSNERFERKEAVTDRLADRLDGLVDKNGRLVGSEAELKTVIDALNSEIPSLALTFDSETKSINKNAAAVRALMQSKIDLEKYQKNLEAYNERMRNSIALEEAAAKAKAELEARNRELAEAQKYNAENSDGLFISLHKQEEAVRNAKAAYDQAVSDMEDNQTKMAELEDEMTAYGEGQDKKTKGSEGTFDGIISELERLSEEYDKVYASAYDSIRGQYSMWSEAAEVVPESIGKLNENLQGQIDYWASYNENIRYLQDFASSNNLEGLAGVLEKVGSAGSEKSVNLVAGLADAAKKGNTEALTGLIENLQALSEEQDIAAKAFADYVTDFQGNSDELILSAESMISGLSLEDEAANAARDTMEAYVQQFSDGSYAARIEEAVGKVKLVVGNALTSASGGTVTEADWRGSHYASGTSSAPGGWALVGEEGPELIRMSGGEQVLNHGDTTRVLRDTNAPASNNNIAVSFNISGSADNNTVAALQQYADDFAERVLDVINSASADSMRRAYA